MVQRFAHSPFVLWPLEMMKQIQPSLSTFSSYCPRRWAALSLVLQFVPCLLHPHPPVPKVFYGQYLFKIFENICRDDGRHKGFIGYICNINIQISPVVFTGTMRSLFLHFSMVRGNIRIQRLVFSHSRWISVSFSWRQRREEKSFKHEYLNWSRA